VIIAPARADVTRVLSIVAAIYCLSFQIIKLPILQPYFHGFYGKQVAFQIQYVSAAYALGNHAGFDVVKIVL